MTKEVFISICTLFYVLPNKFDDLLIYVSVKREP